LRSRCGRDPSPRRTLGRRAPPRPALDRAGVGRERGLADRRRGHALLRLPRPLRGELQRLLPAAHDRPLAPHAAGIAIEFRSHVDSPAWTPVWDVVFSLSSLLLVVFYAAALGNVVRGVPLTAEGWFFAPLWTDLRGGPAASFLASAAYLAGMLASAAFSVHPFVLPAIGDARHALTVDNAAAPGAGLRIGLAWWVPGMLLAVAHCAYTYRRFRGKVTLEGEGY